MLITRAVDHLWPVNLWGGGPVAANAVGVVINGRATRESLFFVKKNNTTATAFTL